MKLLFGTGNEYKYQLMKKRLEEIKEIELINPKMINLKLDIIEDGQTPEENAIKKAKQYYEASGIATIAEDSGLYIDAFPEDEQPGLFVKRINGREDASDTEILNYYIEKLKKYGGESLASYHTGVCIIDEAGKIHSKIIEENKFLMTSNKNNIPTISGGILDCISYDTVNKKYFNERNEEEKAIHYKNLDEEYREIIKNIIWRKNER